MKGLPNKATFILRLMPCILLSFTLHSGCSSVITLPGARLAEAGNIYLLGLHKDPYMIYLTAEEPKERSRSFSLVHRVTASGTLLYPGNIQALNQKALSYFQKVLGEKIRMVPKRFQKISKISGGSKRTYYYSKFECDYYIRLRFRKIRKQSQASYTIFGTDFLKGAYSVYPEGSPLLLEIFLPETGSRKFKLVYQKSLDLFPKNSASAETMGEPFTWHLAYSSGEKQLRFDFRKHVTILRSSALEKIEAFMKNEAANLQKSLP